MIVKTKHFGNMIVEEKDILYFPNGLLGLEEYKRFILFNIDEESKFRCLQSMDEVEIAFILINPWDFYKDYSIDVPEDDLDQIKMKDEKDLFVLNLITIKEDIRSATANLVAPLVINLKERLAAQVVLMKDTYTTKHRLFHGREGE